MAKIAAFVFFLQRHAPPVGGPCARLSDMATSSTRFAGIDALRGAAMLWMTAYHFCFDLQHFGYTRQNFYEDPFWTWQRTGIVSLFLLCAGAGQAIAVLQGQSWPRFWRRWACWRPGSGAFMGARAAHSPGLRQNRRSHRACASCGCHCGKAAGAPRWAAWSWA